MKRIRVYVAGMYSADNVLDVLRNIGRGQKICAHLFKLGFAPFCPWHDRSYVMEYPDYPFTVEEFYDFSIAWLEVCEVVYMSEKDWPNWQSSVGIGKELKRADEIKIPVFYNERDLLDYRITNDLVSLEINIP